MTFNEIVQEVAARLNLTNAESITRIGREVNIRYKRLTTSLGLVSSRRTTVSATSTIGSRELTFTGVEKIIGVSDRSTVTTGVNLTERTFEELRAEVPQTGTATQYAIETMGAHTVTIFMDTVPAATFTLYADGHARATALSNTQEPAFAESFHDILVEGVCADELRKQEKLALATASEAVFERRLSELRFFIAKSSYLDIVQGKNSPSVSTPVSLS